LGEKRGFTELDIIVSFDGADGCESQAGAAISLVCSGGHKRSPIDFGRLLKNWFRNGNFVCPLGKLFLIY